MNLKLFVPFLLLSAFSLFVVPYAAGDEIKLKNGESLNGKITLESDDIVKIETAVSGTIKQTHTIARSDIAEIIKEAPDKVAFAKLQGLLPTPSLLPASRYKRLIEAGPAMFLRDFPDSQHAEEAKAIEEQLKEELDKVERGFVKIDDDWISPQERAEFSALTESRIALLNMKSAVRSRNYNGYITALREFEKLEERYMGSPTFPVALQAAKEIIPNFGSQLKTMLRNVEYLNQQYEQNLAAMDEVAREQVAAARQKEIENYEAGVEADKDKGIKWVRLDPRSKSAIESYIALAQEELERIQTYDISALEEQAEMLVEADQLATNGKLDAARSTLKRASSIPTKSTGGSRSSSSRGSTSYLAAIENKISKKEARAEAEAEAREDALASEALAQNLKGQESGESSNETDTGEENNEESTSEKEPEESTSEKPKDDFAALANPSKKEKGKEKPKSSTKATKKPQPNERENEERTQPVAEVADSGGGIPVMRIIQIATGLLLLTVVGLKFLKK